MVYGSPQRKPVASNMPVNSAQQAPPSTTSSGQYTGGNNVAPSAVARRQQRNTGTLNPTTDWDIFGSAKVKPVAPNRADYEPGGKWYGFMAPEIAQTHYDQALAAHKGGYFYHGNADKFKPREYMYNTNRIQGDGPGVVGGVHTGGISSGQDNVYDSSKRGWDYQWDGNRWTQVPTGGAVANNISALSQAPTSMSAEPALARSANSAVARRRQRGSKSGGGMGGSRQQKAKRRERSAFKSYISGDSTYQSSLSALKNQLEDFILSNKNQRGDVRDNFQRTSDKMGLERKDALGDMVDDFGARGILQSSEYLGSVGDYDKKYQGILGDLTHDRDKNIEDLLESLRMYRTSNLSERQNARAEAIRRRTQKFGR